MRNALSPARMSATRRILIHRDATTHWDLICDGSSLMIERVAAAGAERYTLEAFEASVDGQRLSNALTVALARAPNI